MVRAVPDLTKATILDTSILPHSTIVDHAIAMDAQAAGRTPCDCEFWTTPYGPEPNAVQHDDGSVWCADCGGWMLDAD